jgi:hypothetical protein
MSENEPNSDNPYGKPRGSHWKGVVSNRERTGFLDDLTDQQLLR